MKIHEYNEMMAYLTRPAMKTGGRIGYGIGDIVKPIPRVGKVYASGEKIIEYGTKAIEILESTLASKAIDFFKNTTGPARNNMDKARKFLNKIFAKEREINPNLNKVSIDKVSPTGSISYRVNTPDGFLSDKGLENIITKKDNYFYTKEKPFRDAGYISTDEAVSFLKEKGFATRKQDPSGKGLTTAKTDLGAGGAKGQDPIVKRLGNLAKEYGIDTKQGPGYGGRQIFVKKSDLENNIDQILKDYLPKKEKLALAKNLADEFGAESYFQINKLLKQRGYSAIENKDLDKYFKSFKAKSRFDEDFVPSKIPTNVIQKIRREKIKTYGAPNVEKVLTSLKKNLGFGQTTELMHPLTKKKATESLYDPEDLMFGSFKENRQYNQGLEGIRNTVQNTLIKIKNNFSPKDLKNNITVEVPNYLRRDYDFPKTMPIKKYVEKLNYMMTDISLKTDGKVRGALLDENFKLVESKLGVDYTNVPGMGLIEDNLKSLDSLFKKLKYDRSKGYESGNLLFDDKGVPLLKKGKKLTNEEAETLATFLGNINKKTFEKFSKSQPVSVEEVKEAFKRIPNKKGGRVELAEGSEGLPAETLPAIAAAAYNPLKFLGKKALQALGSVPASLTFFTVTVKKNLKEGKSLADAIVDAEAGIELLYPEVAKRAGFGMKVLNPIAKRMTPVGVGLTVAGALKDRAIGMVKEGKRISTLEGDEQEQAIENLAAKDYRGYNQGGRVGFDEGSKPKSPGRRAFLKGITALAALPLVGRFFKMGEVLQSAKPYLGPTIEKIKGMPEWFPSLVKKLYNEGEDVTKQVATKERMVVKRGTLEGGDEVDMYYDLDTGDVSISVTPKKGGYETTSGAYNKEYGLDYTKGQADEMTKSKKPPDEFGVAEIEGRMDQQAMDVDWEGKMTTVDDALTDLTELEAFAKNKTTKQIHKKKGTKKKDVFPDYDPY